MDLSEDVLGVSVTTRLRESHTATVLRIGQDVFTRAELARVECVNFAAAANLSRILSVELHVKNTQDLFTRIAPQDLVLPRLGAVSLAVLGAAFEHMGLGGDAPLLHWVQAHQKHVITFGSLKHRQQQAEKKKTQKKAKRQNTRTLRPLGRTQQGVTH